jgi:tetratricopeptide (TPR) repeat protein
LQKSFAGGALLLLLTLGAVTERQLGWWQDSETLFRHALAVTKNNDIAHANLGLALETQGRFDEALTEYRAAANINPHYYLFRFAAGHMEEKIGKPAGAASEYRECLRFAPQNSTFHNALGDALAAEGNFAESQKECAEALRLDPGYALPHIVMAKIFFKQGQSSQAVAELWNAAKAEPYNSDVLAQVAHSLAANQDAAARDGTSALALAARANQLSNHRHPEVPDILGMACAETGDFTRAVICAQTALEIAADIKWTNTAPMRQRLELYQNRQTWRESFGPTNEPAGK